MANIPLKTIKFPGLANTYTIPEVSTDLTASGKAAEAAKVGAELATLGDQLDTNTEDIDKLKADLGALDDLETTAKSSIVAAINEANANGGSDVSVVDRKLIIDGVEYDITSEDAVGIFNITKTGTSGLVDTYTITMTDGTTYTFTVTNGDVDDAEIQAYIEDWLNDHPEATTTIEDGAITTSKLSEEVKSQLGTRPNHNYLYNSTQQEGTSTFVELFQKVKNEVMDEYRGNIDKIPFILITDPHGQLSGRKSIFQAISSVVNWYDVSKFFNLGDVVTSTYGTYTNSTDELTTNGQLETMISVLSPIPMDKQVNVFGNHDSWCYKTGDEGYKMLPQNLLAPYFRNAQGHRMGNAGYFSLKDDYFNVKYVVLSGFEYTGGVGVNVGNESASTEQITWLIKELGEDDGYDIVIICHEPLFPDWAGRSFESRHPRPSTSSKTGSVNNTNRWAWLYTDDIFLARKNKTTGSFTDRSGVVHTFDYSGLTGNLLCGLDGHLHFDCSQYTGNDEFLCESFGSFKPDQGGFLYFGLIDRENGRLNIWKIQHENLYYENYQVPFAIPSTAGTFVIKRRLKNTETYQISNTIREGQTFYDIVFPTSSSYTVGYVKVLMGGVDVTSTYYDATTHEIRIPSVTGDIDITAYDSTTSSSAVVRTVTNRFENTESKKPTVYGDEYYEKPICVNDGASYSETITHLTGNNYCIYDIAVLHGDVDITETLTINRSTFSLSIASVEADVVVAAKAILTNPVDGKISNTGELDSTATNYVTTTYIPIDSDVVGRLRCSPEKMTQTSYISFYDEDYTFIKTVYLSSNSVFAYTPTNTKFVRVSLAKDANYVDCSIFPYRDTYTSSVTATATGTGLTLGEYPMSIRTGDSVTIPITMSEDGIVIIDTCTAGGANIDYVLTENSIVVPYTNGDVVVSAHLKKTVLYRLSEDTTLTNTTINTGVKIVDTLDDSFTVMLDFTIIGTQANSASIASTASGTNNGWYIRRQLQIAYIEGKYAGQSFTDGTNTRHALNLGTRCKIVLTHVGGNDSYVATLKAISYGDESPHVLTATNGGGSTSNRRIDSGNLILGSGNMTVTFHNVLVLSRVATDSETDTFLTFE